MPHGKAAGQRCVQLDASNGCLIFGQPERPAVCVSLKPEPQMCGDTREHAMAWLDRLELQSQPARAG
jgi:uncharacterized protein